MDEIALKSWAESLSVDDIEKEGKDRLSVLRSFGGLGISTSDFNAMVDMAHLLGAAISIARGRKEPTPGSLGGE